MNPQLQKHLLDVLKGAFGSACVYFAIGFLQYVGAHIPDLVQILGATVGGVTGVKTLQQ